MRTIAAIWTATFLLLVTDAVAQHGHGSGNASRPEADSRTAVSFPAPLREHTLANMRDHLLALQEIQQALAAGAFDKAGVIAEQRLGMSSMQRHGAHEVARYMPAGMQAAGSAMHRSASRFATATSDAAVSNDVRPALAALAEVTATCVACHAAYRFQ
jgi:hypothetical protein